MHAGRVAVFLVDDHQPVRHDEIGSSKYILEYASAKGYKVFDYTLDAQFRCLGSDAFISWVSCTLGVEPDDGARWNVNSAFEFRIFDSAEMLDAAIQERIQQGFKARMTAGFCWKWSAPKDDGILEDDVQLPGFSRPWNAKPDGDKSRSFDTVVKRSGEKFVQLVQNTYRVLLTRGLKGCYVHFMDKETESYFRDRLTMEGSPLPSVDR